MLETRAFAQSAAAVIAAATLAACSEAESRTANEIPTPVVEAIEARYGALPLRERLTGTVRAAGQVSIYPEASGPVVEVLAENGDRVRAGDPLVRIRSEVPRTELQQSEADVASAVAARERARTTVADLERRYERSERLAAEDFISQEEFETLRTQLSSARATLAQAEAQVDRAEASVGASNESVRQTVVRAPIDGTVGRRNAEVGMFVAGSTPLFTIGRLEEVEVDVPITQDMLARIRPGQTAEIRSASLGDSVVRAEVSRVSPFIEPGSFSAEIQIDVDNANGALLPGMFVTVEVLYGESEQATLVPKSAIWEDPATGATGIVTAPSIGLEVPITRPEVGADQPPPETPPTPMEFRRIEVLAEGRHVVGVTGIDPGDWVVVVGQHLVTGRAGTSTEGPPQARVRPISWDRLLELQGLQREDLLRQFMDKQQRIAKAKLDSLETANRTARAPGEAGGN